MSDLKNTIGLAVRMSAMEWRPIYAELLSEPTTLRRLGARFGNRPDLNLVRDLDAGVYTYTCWPKVTAWHPNIPTMRPAYLLQLSGAPNNLGPFYVPGHLLIPMPPGPIFADPSGAAFRTTCANTWGLLATGLAALGWRPRNSMQRRPN